MMNSSPSHQRPYMQLVYRWNDRVYMTNTYISLSLRWEPIILDGIRPKSIGFINSVMAAEMAYTAGGSRTHVFR